MPHIPVELSNVIYNAATQSFEALARVHDPAGARSYACAIDAPIDMEFDRAAEGLTCQALRRHRGGPVRSFLPQARIVERRSTPLVSWRQRASALYGSLRPAA